MYPEFLLGCLKMCKSQRIHTCVDTSGFAPFSSFESILPYTDLFLYDIKSFSSDLHKQLTGVDNALIWDNLEKLCEAGANINLRIPVIEGCNSDLSDIELTAAKAQSFGIKKVNILPYHDMGKYKYTKLGREYDGNSMATPSDEKLASIVQIFEKHSFTDVKIGG